MPRLALAPVVSLCATLCAGCFDDSSSVVTIPTRSLLTVDPAVFLDAVNCGAPELRRYVVKVFDISVDARTEFVSAPTDCTNKVSFAAPPLVRDDFYTAEIDGYDRDDVTPASEGSATMIDPATGQVVSPRWKTSCGGGADVDASQPFDGSANPVLSPTRLFEASEVFLSGCLPLHEVAADGPPSASAAAAPDAGGGPDHAQ